MNILHLEILLQSNHFKKAQKDEKQKQQKIKNDELLNKVASRRDFLRGKSSTVIN
jgi:hypothetical protein